MKVQVAEVSVADLILLDSIDRSVGGFVYEHLKYYCSKFRPLPTIAVISDGKRLVVSGRYLYALIARELGDERIRAVLDGSTFEELQKQGVLGLLDLVPNEVIERELREEVIDGLHVFFFKKVPSEKTITEIEARFRRFLMQSLPEALGDTADLQISASFDATGPRFEINFPTPVTNHPWAASYYAFIVSISRELSEIDTYQGCRFEVTDV